MAKRQHPSTFLAIPVHLDRDRLLLSIHPRRMTQLGSLQLAQIAHPRLDASMAYAAKLERTSVRIVNTANGSTVRTISGSFAGAVVQGEEVHLTEAKGRIRVVNIRTGSTIRTI